jgi:hypothetical protein
VSIAERFIVTNKNLISRKKTLLISFLLLALLVPVSSVFMIRISAQPIASIFLGSYDSHQYVSPQILANELGLFQRNHGQHYVYEYLLGAANNTTSTNAVPILDNNNTNSNITRSSSNSSFLTYQNSSLGIRIKYPPNWMYEVKGDPSGTVIEFSSPKGTNNNTTLSTAVEKLTFPNESLQQYTDAYIRGIIHMITTNFGHTSFKLNGLNSSILAGSPAYSIDYTINNTLNSVNIVDVVTVKNDRAYFITFSPSPIFLPVIQKMAGSFEILQPIATSGIAEASNNSNSTFNTTNSLSYENSTYGIKIRYPFDWQRVQPNDTYSKHIIVEFDSPQGSIFDISSIPLPPSVTVDDYNAAGMISLEHFTGFNATELSATTIAGSPAYKIVFTVGDGKIEHMQVKTVVGNRG